MAKAKSYVVKKESLVRRFVMTGSLTRPPGIKVRQLWEVADAHQRWMKETGNIVNDVFSPCLISSGSRDGNEGLVLQGWQFAGAFDDSFDKFDQHEAYQRIESLAKALASALDQTGIRISFNNASFLVLEEETPPKVSN
jgi:hypothetical protein